jgi:hypothetical protein
MPHIIGSVGNTTMKKIGHIEDDLTGCRPLAP